MSLKLFLNTHVHVIISNMQFSLGHAILQKYHGTKKNNYPF